MPRSSSLRIEPIFAPDIPAVASRERPVDLVHLSHQTMGDAALEREVLGLLGRQLNAVSGRLDGAELDERHRVAHALKGACLNVGAFRLARAAEALESHPASIEALRGFETEMRTTALFVADLLRG
ncbi:hypothetical protein ASG43_18790 [Aureimonas sp. Leaf454]|uniref:Hpt domain-containing protein n=1 Tax=Aureimonas sp. Leaf454 TaxID=1736381 RepID=UPI0006FF8CD7|nr:Hpt domain-containing protein [Aureimonas sp. Leaf454]KQT53269.1 hypothetical protein ASG43_18790 [Aureimonas sp. Leaf454]